MKRESHTERKENGMSIGSKRERERQREDERKRKMEGKERKYYFFALTSILGPEGIFFGYSYTILFVTIFSSLQ